MNIYDGLQEVQASATVGARMPPPPPSMYDGLELAPAQPGQPRGAVGPLESFQAGIQGSVAGLAWRQKIPDLVMSPDTQSWWERAITGVTQVAADLPIMYASGVIGGAKGAALGAAISGPAAPAGAAVGGILAGGAAMFGVVGGIRESLMQAYRARDAETPADWFNIVRDVAKAIVHESAVGAVTMGTGALARGGAAAVMGAGTDVAKAVGLGTATMATRGAARATGAVDVAGQIAGMVTMPAALDGRLPGAQEFADAAVVILTLKAGHVALDRSGILKTKKMVEDTYVKTGKTPAEQVADAKADARIAEDFVGPPEPDVRTSERWPDPIKVQEQLFTEVARRRDLEGTVPVVTPEATTLIREVDRGNAPAGMTEDLRRIAADNGIEVTDATTPKTVVDAIRAKMSDQDTLISRMTEEQALEHGRLTAKIAALQASLTRLQAFETSTERVRKSVMDAMANIDEARLRNDLQTMTGREPDAMQTEKYASDIAELVVKRIVQRAQRLGKTPDEVYGEYVQLKSGFWMPDARLDSPPHRAGLEEAARARRASMPPAPGKIATLIGDIQALGGIDKGSMTDTLGDNKVSKGIPFGLFHKNGESLDDLVVRLNEAPYHWGIDTNTSDGGIKQLQEMIRAEASSPGAYHRQGDEAAIGARNERDRAAYEVQAIKKALSGEKTTEQEEAIVRQYLDEHDAMAKLGPQEYGVASAAVKAEPELTGTAKDAIDAAAVERALAKDPEAVENADAMSNGDNAAFMREIRRILGEPEPSTDTSGEANARAAASAAEAAGRAAIERDGTPAVRDALANGNLEPDTALAIATAAPGNEALQAIGIRAVSEGSSTLFAVNLMKAAEIVRGEKPALDPAGIVEAENLAGEATKRQMWLAKAIETETDTWKKSDLQWEQHELDSWQTKPELIAKLRELKQGPVRAESARDWKDAPIDEADYVTWDEISRLEHAPYVKDGLVIANSRQVPNDQTFPAVGTWRISTIKGIHGREIEQLVELPIASLKLGELDRQGRLDPTKAGDDARYAEWLKEGRRPPPITVLQQDAGTLSVMDGHRRALAAQRAGQKTIEAWVNYAVPIPDGGRINSDSSKPFIRTGMTYEMLTGEIPNPYLDRMPFSMSFDLKPETPAELQARNEEAVAQAKRKLLEERNAERAAKGLAPTVDQADLFNTQGTLFQSQPGEWYYSELARQIERLPANRVPADGMSAEQWKKLIWEPETTKRVGLRDEKNKPTGEFKEVVVQGKSPLPGVTRDEINASQVREWLDVIGTETPGTSDGTKPPIPAIEKITREQVLDFIKKGGLRVQDVVLGHEGQKTLQDAAIADDVRLLTEKGFRPEANPEEDRIIAFHDVETGDLVGAAEMRAWMAGGEEPKMQPIPIEVVEAAERVERYWNDAPGQFRLTEFRSTVGRFPERSFNTRAEAEAEGQRRGGQQVTEMMMPIEGATQFGQWQLPGGKNYREAFITLPEIPGREAKTQAPAELMNHPMWSESDYRYLRNKGYDAARIKEFWDRDQAAGKAPVVHDRPQAEPGVEWSDGHGAYDDIRNPIMRYRFNEREIPRETIAPISDIGRRLVEAVGARAESTLGSGAPIVGLRKGVITQAEAHAYAKAKGFTNADDFKPAAVDRVMFLEELQPPVKAEFAKMPEYLQKNWLEMGLKRVMVWAAQNGFDKVSWTTGGQQVERYTNALRKNVDAIEWEKTPEGVQLVGYKKGAPRYPAPNAVTTAANRAIERNDNLGFETPGEARSAIFQHRGPGGEDWLDRWHVETAEDRRAIQAYVDAISEAERTKVVDTRYAENELSDALGKAMADRIRNDPGQKGVIEGENLRIDETGMYGLYDRMVPATVNRILKDLKVGGKVADVELGIRSEPPQTVQITEALTRGEIPTLKRMTEDEMSGFQGAESFENGDPPVMGTTKILVDGTPQEALVVAGKNGLHIVTEDGANEYMVPGEAFYSVTRGGGSWDSASRATKAIYEEWGKPDGAVWENIEHIVGDAVKTAPVVTEAKRQPQMGFDITPEMRDKAEAGLPLFQKLREEHRAAYSKAEKTITLFKTADRSSVLHELTHDWVEELKADAARPDAPQQLKDDWNILRREFAIPETGNIPTIAHEQLAKTGERYFAEGEAPSIALRGIFERLRVWMLDIYKSVEKILGLEINPDVRGVFDRMLASDEEIAAARELGVPRAYVGEAKATEARKIVPGEAARRAAENPFTDELPPGPGEAPDNTHVNYAYINSPMDVKLAMQRMAEIDQENIQKQRGGREGVKSWEEANAEQAKYVNDILGGSEDTLRLLSQRDPDAPGPDVKLGILKKLAVGAAKDSARLRDVIIEKGHDATVREQLDYMGSIERARMIQAEFLGERAGVARALNALKDTTEGTGEIAKMLEVIGVGDNTMFQSARTPAQEQAYLKAKLDEILQNYRGKSVLDIARLHKEIGTLKGSFKFSKDVTQATKWEMVVEGWKSSLLSGPVTHTTNLFGTGAFQALRAPVDALATVIGMARGASPGMGESDRASMSEAVARVTGMLGGVQDAMKVGYHTFKADEATGKTESYREAIPGRIGHLIRIPLRLMGAEDAIVSTMYRRGELKTLAIRQAFDENLNPGTREFAERVDALMDKPTEDMQVAADTAATRMTFNAPLGEKGVSLQLFVNKWNLQWMIPFIRTPINIAKELARMSPFAPVVGEWRADVAKGGIARDRALAEIALGSGIMAVTMAYAFSGNVSGSGSPDPGKNRGKAGVWQPYSILIDGKWYEYARIQPTGTLMGMAADIADVWDHMNEEEKDKVPKMLARAFANAITNQTFLQGITNVVNALSDPTRFGGRFVQQAAGSLVPNIVGQPTAMADPYVREVNSALEAIQARVPGMREQLIPKRDWLGKPVETKERPLAVMPVRIQPVSEDKVRLEAARLDISMAAAPKKTHIGKGTGKLGDVELTPEERDTFEKVGGEMAHKILGNIVNSPGYDQIPDLVKRNIFSKVLRASHQVAAVAALPMDKRIAYIQSISEKVAAALEPENP